MTSDKFLAVARRDLLTSLRHRNSVVVLVVGLLAELASFYYLARAIGLGSARMASIFGNTGWHGRNVANRTALYRRPDQGKVNCGGAGHGPPGRGRGGGLGARGLFKTVP